MLNPSDMNPHEMYSRRAERVILAALMREPQLATEACIHHEVTEGSLYFHHHRLVWNAVWSLVESALMPNLVSVYQTLQCRGELRELDPVNPALALVGIWESDPTGAWVDWACDVVAFHARRRDAIHRAKEVMQLAYAGQI